jgi:hypothetical protein
MHAADRPAESTLKSPAGANERLPRCRYVRILDPVGWFKGKITPMTCPRCVKMYEVRESLTWRKMRAACVFNSRTPTTFLDDFA